MAADGFVADALVVVVEADLLDVRVPVTFFAAGEDELTFALVAATFAGVFPVVGEAGSATLAGFDEEVVFLAGALARVRLGDGSTTLDSTGSIAAAVEGVDTVSGVDSTCVVRVLGLRLILALILSNTVFRDTMNNPSISATTNVTRVKKIPLPSSSTIMHDRV